MLKVRLQQILNSIGADQMKLDNFLHQILEGLNIY